jgi:hypothetical protein
MVLHDNQIRGGEDGYSAEEVNEERYTHSNSTR